MNQHFQQSLRKLILSVLAPALLVAAAHRAHGEEGELLYNGIRLPKVWPPRFKARDEAAARKVPPVPYLENPPAVIPIDVGRQLFVDDFLIGNTTLKRRFHYPQRYEGNPILKPETALERNGGSRPCATLFNDGVWFDPKDRFFKMWYHAGWFDGTAYAVSKDGLHWERPELDVVKGANRVIPKENHGARDGSAVWLDHDASDPNQRFKMFLYERPDKKYGGQIFTSPNGIQWSGPTRTGKVGDNTTILYNPFRKKWVYSIRTELYGRSRGYREADDLLKGAQWMESEQVPWAGADNLDQPEPRILAMMPSPEVIKKEARETGKDYKNLLKEYRFNYGDPPQLYNLDAVPYESLMLGVFTILKGPHNRIAEKLKKPKTTDLTLAYSRDGFHWHRPDRRSFLASTHKEGDWEFGYLHPSASICAVVGDKLYFYYGGWSGKSPKLGGDMYAGGSTGVAFLRRDGFVSMDADARGGTLTTRPVTFKGRYLFVNLEAPRGELRAEALDKEGNPIVPFTAQTCLPLTGDKTCQKVSWKGVQDLSALAGRKVRFRFHLTDGNLYSFWVTPDARGASFGYVAAGGPEFDGPIDTVGTNDAKL